MQARIKKIICTFGAWAALTGALAMAQQPRARHWAIVVHGGAGDIDRAELGPERDKAYREALSEAVKAGAAVLDRGGSALDAVEAAIRVMENDPHFNAARGAVFTAAGRTELDAAIMDGATLRAGAVADVTHTRYPITLARTVMEKTPYVLLVGPGADAFSLQAGMEQEGAAYFFTESRWQSLVKQLQKEGKPIPPRPTGGRRRTRPCRCRNSKRRRTRIATARLALWRSTEVATSPPELRRAACRARCRAAWATRR